MQFEDKGVKHNDELILLEIELNAVARNWP
jgi:hypothetical protein